MRNSFLRRKAALCWIGAGAMAICSTSAVLPVTARAADHGDASVVRDNPQLDVNDVYLFPNPSDSSRIVVMLTTGPLCGQITPARFATKGRSYVLRFDTDNDALPDSRIRVTFGDPNGSGVQAYKLRFHSSEKDYEIDGVTGTPLTLPDGGKAVAGIYDDPFFFDAPAFKANLSFDSDGGSNFFFGWNTAAIVVELPVSSFPSYTKIGVWGVTRKRATQIDREGKPALSTALIPAARKNEFNDGQPVNDLAVFGADAQATITNKYGNGAQAAALVAALFPDILYYSPGSPVGYPNGRGLKDDVIDVSLSLLSNGAVTSDFVADDSATTDVFPYLAPKNP